MGVARAASCKPPTRHTRTRHTSPPPPRNPPQPSCEAPHVRASLEARGVRARHLYGRRPRALRALLETLTSQSHAKSARCASAPRARVSTRTSRSNAHPRAQGVWCTRPGAPCGARSRCFPWCRARREIFVGVGDSHGPYERSADSRRAPRARGAYVPWGRGVDYVTMRTPRRTVWGTVVPHEDGNGPRRNPHGRGRWPQAVRAARTRPACTPCS